MGRKAVVLQDDENLAVEVRKYPVLYDKSCKLFKEKQPKLNAWHRIDEELGYEKGEAEEKFGNLKARYSRRKTAVRKAKKSGEAGTKDLVSAETALSLYNFLRWLDPFLSGTESISNLDDSINIADRENRNLNDESENDAEDGEKNDFDDCIKIEEYESDKEITEEDVEEKSPVMKTKIEKPKQPLRKVPDKIPSSKKTKVSGDERLATIDKRLQERSGENPYSSKVTEDADDIFGKMVAHKLRSLSSKRKIKLEFEINSAIFKYVSEEQDEKEAMDRAEAFYHQRQIELPERNQSSTGCTSSYNSNHFNIPTMLNIYNKEQPQSPFQFSHNNMNSNSNDNSDDKQS